MENFDIIPQRRVMEEGRCAFYDNVPIYKNPYDNDLGSIWYDGWESANREHILFTEVKSFQSLLDDHKTSLEEKDNQLRVVLEKISECIQYLETCNMFFFRRQKMLELLELVGEEVKSGLDIKVTD